MDAFEVDIGKPQMRSVLVLLCMALFAMPAKATEVAWAKLAEGGHTILLRHAKAPGTGDPVGFVINDCTSQRNLSEEGRQQARRIGARLIARNVNIQKVLTSQWCRASQTAKLAFPALKVEVEPQLNSFFSDASTKETQTKAIVGLIKNYVGPGNQVMVTHQVNITALTNLVPREGEAIIVDFDPANGSVKVIGRQLFD